MTTDLSEIVRSQRPQLLDSYLFDTRRTLSGRLAILPHLASFVRSASDAMYCCLRQEPVLKIDGDMNRILARSGGMYAAYCADLRALAREFDWDLGGLSRVVRASFEADTHLPLRVSGSRLVSLALDRRRHHEALHLVASVALCEDQWRSAVEREMLGQPVESMYFCSRELSDLVAVDQAVSVSDMEAQDGRALASEVCSLYKAAMNASTSLGDYLTP